MVEPELWLSCPARRRRAGGSRKRADRGYAHTPLGTVITILEGRVFRPNSTSVFALVCQHDTNMEDWEAEWNELANNKAWVSKAQLAGSTQKTVQDFRRWWDRYTPSLPLYKQKSVRSLTPQKL